MRMFHDRSSTSGDNSSSRHEKRKSLSDGVDLMSHLNLSNNAAEIFHSSSRLSDAAAEELCTAVESASNEDSRLFLSEKKEQAEPKVVANRGLFDEPIHSTVSQLEQNNQQPGLNGFGNPKLTRQERKHRRMKSKSEGVSYMRSSFDTAKFEALSELVNMPAEVSRVFDTASTLHNWEYLILHTGIATSAREAEERQKFETTSNIRGSFNDAARSYSK